MGWIYTDLFLFWVNFFTEQVIASSNLIWEMAAILPPLSPEKKIILWLSLFFKVLNKTKNTFRNRIIMHYKTLNSA